MASGTSKYLTRREQQLMDIIDKLSEATVAELVDLIPEPVTESGVRVFLKTMEKKGRIRRRKVGRKFIYEAKESRQVKGRSALRKVLGTFFDNSLTSAISSHLSDPSVKLKDDELDRIAQIIEKTRKRNG